jgi:hypothetical protein
MRKMDKIIKRVQTMSEIICHCRFNPQALELEYAMAYDVAEIADVEIIEILEFVKKLSAQTKYTYEECIEYAHKYFVSGDYKIYSPDEYSLLVSQDYLFVIPSKDSEPTRLIKMA